MATYESPQHSRMSAAALAVGLLSLPAAFLPFGIPIAPIAVALGFAARRDAIKSQRPVRMAHSAIILGVIATLIWVAIISGFTLFAGVYEG